MRLSTSAFITAASALAFVLFEGRKKIGLEVPANTVYRDDLIEPHRGFLRANFPKALKKFDDLRKTQPEAATAEAAVFSMLYAANLNPEPLDKANVGGLDFICKPADREPFAVEVTAILAEKVAEHTRIPLKLENDKGGAFEMLTPQQQLKVVDKVTQIAKHKCRMPVVVVVCTLHERAQGPFRRLAADWLLTSVPSIVTPPNLTEPVFQKTDLRYSVFLENDGRLSAKCKSVSAVLLMTITESLSTVIGILHHEADFPLDVMNFPSVPFRRIVWPVTARRINTEWATEATQIAYLWHYPVG